MYPTSGINAVMPGMSAWSISDFSFPRDSDRSQRISKLKKRTVPSRGDTGSSSSLKTTLKRKISSASNDPSMDGTRSPKYASRGRSLKETRESGYTEFRSESPLFPSFTTKEAMNLFPQSSKESLPLQPILSIPGARKSSKVIHHSMSLVSLRSLSTSFPPSPSPTKKLILRKKSLPALPLKEDHTPISNPPTCMPFSPFSDTTRTPLSNSTSAPSSSTFAAISHSSPTPQSPSSLASLESMTFRSIESLSEERERRKEKARQPTVCRADIPRLWAEEARPRLSQSRNATSDSRVDPAVSNTRRRSWTIALLSKERRSEGSGFESDSTLAPKFSMPLLHGSRPIFPSPTRFESVPPYSAVATTFTRCVDEAYYRQYIPDLEMAQRSQTPSLTKSKSNKAKQLGGKMLRFFSGHRKAQKSLSNIEFTPTAIASHLHGSRPTTPSAIGSTSDFVSPTPKVKAGKLPAKHKRHSSEYEHPIRTVDQWNGEELKEVMDRLRRLK